MRTNTKEVSQKIQEHILDYYEGDKEQFIHDVDAVKYGYMGNLQALEVLVESGVPLTYDSDIVEFLNGLGINPENKEYPIQKSRDLYKNLIVREGVKLLGKF